MPPSGSPHASPPPADGDGVRVVRLQPARAAMAPWIALLLVASVVALAWWRWPEPSRAVTPHAVSGSDAPAPSPVEQSPVPAHQPTRAPAPVAADAPALAPAPQVPWASPDPNDLANYIPPGTPEPTMKEVIEALHAAGDKRGLGAFNPPGTSPPLQGLAVPPDFELPPGYVRHHQVTDAGEPIEPILMFSPDYQFRDAAGNLVPIPENRVVPPEMAPPGLPIRQVEITPPPQ